MLDEFAGTIMLVTHDRYLVDRLASQLWILRPEETRLEVFEGPWTEYAAMRAQEVDEEEARTSKEKWSEAERRARREERRARREEEARQQQVAVLEAEIHELEQQIKALQEEIAEATAAQEALRIHELGSIYGELDARLQERLELWASLAA